MLRAELADLADLGDRSSAAAVIIMIGLAASSMYQGDFRIDRDWAGEAVTAARRLDDRPLLGAALAVHALVVLMGVRVDGAPADGRDAAGRHLTGRTAFIHDPVVDDLHPEPI